MQQFFFNFFLKNNFASLDYFIKVFGIKKPVKYCFTGFFCGVAENRTRVQTSNQAAFYTFIFCLVFRSNARPETATSPLVFLIFVAA